MYAEWDALLRLEGPRARRLAPIEIDDLHRAMEMFLFHGLAAAFGNIKGPRF